MLINMRKLYFASAFILLGFFAITPFAFAADTTAPKILKVYEYQNFDTDLYIRFDWTTDEKTTGKVEWGMSLGNYANSLTGGATGAMFHYIILDDLYFQLGTSYFFRIVATDTAGNVSYSKEYSYTTPGKDIKVIKTKTQDIGSDSAVIQVQLNRTGLIKMSYGELSGNYTVISGGTNRLVLASGRPIEKIKSVLLDGLKPNTKYYAVIETMSPYDENLTTNNIDVTTSVSDEFSFVTTEEPEITGLSPKKGKRGTIVTLNGTNFGNDSGLSNELLRVSTGCAINAQGKSSCLAEIISWTDSEIQFIIKEKSKSGIVYVYKGYKATGYIGAFTSSPRGSTSEYIFTSANSSQLKFSVEGAKISSLVTNSYGCGFSTTARKAVSRYSKTIRVSEFFRQNDKNDAYLKSMQDAYKKYFKRAARCDEMQFHLDHKTSIQKLIAWLKTHKP